MRILLIHNYYRQAGGEDVVFSNESALLRSRGRIVSEYTDENKQAAAYLDVATHMLWSQENYIKLRKLLRDIQPDIAHIHNTFFTLSPSIYYACHAEGIPVVQTLHNYRLLCPQGTFFRDGQACEECLGKNFPWPGLQHACYHQSRIQTAAVGGMLSIHRVLGTWQNKIHAYIALTDFGKQKFIQGGIPAEKITVKPNFVQSDPGLGNHEGGFALYAGRLSPEKGIRTLMQGWKLRKGMPIKIAGDGPLRTLVEKSAETIPGIEYLGKVTHTELLALMKNARVIIAPSECYEGFPLVIAEAFACGLPVITAHHGALSELITDGVTGLHFRPSDADDLAGKVNWAWSHPHEIAQMGLNARREYEEKYTAERNYEMLNQIYERVIKENHA